jgi:hypothetical protein
MWSIAHDNKRIRIIDMDESASVPGEAFQMIGTSSRKQRLMTDVRMVFCALFVGLNP